MAPASGSEASSPKAGSAKAGGGESLEAAFAPHEEIENPCGSQGGDNGRLRRCELMVEMKAFLGLLARHVMGSGLVDAITIATPHYDHPVTAAMAFERGIHALCEKPIAVQGQGVRAMTGAYGAAKWATYVE